MPPFKCEHRNKTTLERIFPLLSIILLLTFLLLDPVAVFPQFCQHDRRMEPEEHAERESDALNHNPREKAEEFNLVRRGVNLTTEYAWNIFTDHKKRITNVLRSSIKYSRNVISR